MKSLLNPELADLDKDGKLSSYEKKRGMAIEESMRDQKMSGGLLNRMSYAEGESVSESNKKMSDEDEDMLTIAEATEGAAVRNAELAQRSIREYIPESKRLELYTSLLEGKEMPEEYKIDDPIPFHISPSDAYEVRPEQFLQELVKLIPEQKVDDMGNVESVEEESREEKYSGGLLGDDRERYGIGGIITKLLAKVKPTKKPTKKPSDITKEPKTIEEKEEQLKVLNSIYDSDFEKLNQKERVMLEDQIERLRHNIQAEEAGSSPFGSFESLEASADLERQITNDANKLLDRGFSKERIDEILEEAYELNNPSELKIALKEPIVRKSKSEGGEMVPDEKMEEQFVDFVIDEALSDKEESMLMEQLEANPELSMIFDKVIEKASEFTGAGEVEGPGTGVSDSIPARLSDGEFVFTANAVKEIGVENLEKMMEDAEDAYNRKNMQSGGEVEEEIASEPEIQEIRVRKETVGPQASMQEEKDLVSDEIKKRMMLDPNQQHVRS